MKKILLLVILIIFLITVSFIFLHYQPRVGAKTITINNNRIIIEIADNNQTRIQGLSGRASLRKDHGMLFVYPSSSYYYFWMKEMKFPLDFIWIDKDKIVDLTENVPLPQTNDISKLPVFTSKYPADKILEINARMTKSLNVKIGDKIQF